ncbi:MAG: hypothetical protein MUF49_05755 [Oculatellaceae cyanobacterium Prado106]|jgi:aminoglycoside phosphotransferase (APT) family kinase protein|nr:hypothetical protein [Oculatellaceae cyanobacterium Prado106]
MADSIEDLIAQAKAKYQNKPPSTVNPAPSSSDADEDAEIADLLAALQEIRQEGTTHLPEPTPSKTSLQLPLERTTEQTRQQTYEQQQQAERERKAMAWLRSLTPADEDYAWFESFAAKYASRVEAAIDFLGLR